MSLSNSLIIHEVNYQPQDVYHITCICLDTQWKTVYHSPVRVVYTTKICTMTTCTKSTNIYYSEVTLLLQCFIFLFKPIYKNINLTIIELDMLKNRKIVFYMFFFSLVIYRKFILNFFFKATILITTLICAENVRNMFSLIFAGFFILKQCIR